MIKINLVLFVLFFFITNCQVIEKTTEEYCNILEQKVKAFEEKLNNFPRGRLGSFTSAFPSFSNEATFRYYLELYFISSETNISDSCISVQEGQIRTLHRIVSFTVDSNFDINYNGFITSSKKINQINGLFSLKVDNVGKLTFSSEFEVFLEKGIFCQEFDSATENWNYECTYLKTQSFTDLFHSDSFDRIVKPRFIQQLKEMFANDFRLFLE
jgi:hypothetical protein